MPISVDDKRALFRSLHKSGCFTLATPRNLGGLRRIETLGAKAIETTSMGFAGWSERTEHQLLGKTSLPHLAEVCRGTDLPVSIDLHEAADEDRRQWAEYVRTAIQAGVAGVSIADRAGDNRISSASVIERIRLAHEVIVRSERDIVLQAPCEGFMSGTVRQDTVLQHLRACAEAGADVLCIPGTGAPSLIKAVVDAVSPKAVSVVIRDSSVNVKTICELGVRRISMGFTLGADQWSGFECGYATVLSRAIEASLHAGAR